MGRFVFNMGGYNVENEKKYYINSIIEMLENIEDIDLLKYLFYFIKLKTNKKQGN